MGRAKDYYDECQSRGYGNIPEKYVCSNCTNHPDLIKYINRHARFLQCSYCDKTFKGARTIHLKTFIAYIMECVKSEWCAAEDADLPYNSREGGYLIDTFCNYELFTSSEVSLELNHEELFNDILSTINIELWAEDWSINGEDEGEFLSKAWLEFTNTVKHKTRFTAFNPLTLKSLRRKTVKPPFYVPVRMRVFLRFCPF